MTAVVLAASLVASSPAQAATTRTVGPGGQYSTIQAAINASSDGDTVQVAAGTYVENIIINGRQISVIGAGASTTTIRAATSSRAVVLMTNLPYVPGPRATLSGFTITGGNSPAGQGGGLTIFNNASPLITDNTITGNSAAAYGGGIEVFLNSNPTIRNNTISANFAGSGGAGIAAISGSSPIIANNVISGNNTSGASIANGGSSGGAIYLENTPDPNARSYPVVLNNTITSNRADFAGGGIMVRTGASPIIEGNTIHDNSASYGGGIHLESTGSTAAVTSNVISSNRATANPGFAGSGFGGGVALFDSTQATIRGNSFTANSASNGGGGLSSAENANSTLVANTFSGNFLSTASSGMQDGGGLYIANSTLAVSNNLFLANHADRGAAAAIYDGAKLTFSYNTVVKNTTTPTAEYGGAIFVRNQASVSANLTSNIFVRNQGWQIFEEVHRARLVNNLLSDPDPTPVLRGTGLYFASGITVASAAELNTIGNSSGNIDTAPGFVDADADNFELLSTSTARDAGESSISPADDLRGVIRQTGTADIGAYEFEATPQDKQTVFRFWSQSKQSHFFTIDEGERDLVATQYSPLEWRYEGIAYEAFPTAVPGTIPLFRFYSARFQGHFFTAVEAEKDSVIENYDDDVWLYEGVAYYVYPSNTVGAREVFRFWSARNRHHFYTASKDESDLIRSIYPTDVWAYEDVAFRVPR